MAHKRKDTLAPPSKWANHLRPFWKKLHSKSERRAASNDIARQQEDAQTGETRASSPAKAREARKQTPRMTWKIKMVDRFARAEGKTAWFTLRRYQTESRARTALASYRPKHWNVRLVDPKGIVVDV